MSPRGGQTRHTLFSNSTPVPSPLLSVDHVALFLRSPAQCIIFDSVNKLGKTIHTTNYMMMVGTSLAIVCR